MTARDLFEIAYDLAEFHDHKVREFRTCSQESCKALARIAGPPERSEVLDSARRLADACEDVLDVRVRDALAEFRRHLAPRQPEATTRRE